MKHPALGTLALVAALLPAACADTGTGSNGGTTSASAAGEQHATRHRPRHAAVVHALEDAATHAQTCLPPSVAEVHVTGGFMGATGEYHVDAVQSDQPLSSELRECVREQFENARVEPFTNERFDAAQAVSRESTAPGATTTATATATNTSPAAGATTAAPTEPMLPTPPVASRVPPPPQVDPTPPPAPTTTTADATPPATPATGPAAGTRHVAAPAATSPGPIAASSIVGCYRTVVRTDPVLTGRARMRFAVGADGAVQNLSIIQTTAGVMRSPLLGQVLHCIDQRVRAQTLAHTAPGAYDVTLAFVPAAGGSITLQQRSGPANASAAQASSDAGNAGGATDTASGGTLDLAQIATVVRRRTADVRTCYTNVLARDGQLRMQLRVRFEIEPAGTVASASTRAVVTAREPDGADEVSRCVEGVVRSTTFPARASGGPMEAVLPFNFSPAGSASASAAATANPTPPLATTGRIDPTRVSMVIRARTPVLRECYTRALGGDPTLAGRVMVHFVVDPLGRVLEVNSQPEVRAGSPARFAEVAHCIEGVMQAMTLPPPTGGAAAVALPFDFGPTSM